MEYMYVHTYLVEVHFILSWGEPCVKVVYCVKVFVYKSSVNSSYKSSSYGIAKI